MERITVISDVHGREIWKKIVDKEYDNTDRFIFLGDYVDSYDIPGDKQLANLLDIIQLKKDIKDKQVTLLIGNHDYHYMDNGTYDCYSGFQAKMRATFNEIFMTNQKLFQVAFADENGAICSHAGITKDWLEKVDIVDNNAKDLVDSINELFYHRCSLFRFYDWDSSGYGDHKLQSPIWVRPNQLQRYGVDTLQIVGHTILDKPDLGNKCIFLDTCNKHYLKCEDGKHYTVYTSPQ